MSEQPNLPPQPENPGEPALANHPTTKADQLGPPVPTGDERTLGTVIHLLGIFTGLVGSLILWLLRGGESKFVDHNITGTLNFRITLAILVVSFIVLGIVVASAELTALAILVVVAFYAGLFAMFIFMIRCCVQAYRGTWTRYPISIRFIK